MLSIHTAFPAPQVRRERAIAAGIGPALIGAWFGGIVLGALVLWSGLGWLAAMAAYSLGGSALLVLFAMLPALALRIHGPALPLAPVHARRSRG